MKRLYDSQKWRNARIRFLDQNPLCAFCLNMGRVEPATVVDHITPHKGDKILFWDQENWQALCKDCHDSSKAIQESKGIIPGCRLDGVPIDLNHPWNAVGGMGVNS